MPRRHAPFCDLHPDRIGHGLYCVSRPIARPAVALNEQGKNAEITVYVAALWSRLDAPRLVQVAGEPNVDGRFMVMASGTARQLAAALLVGGQAEELERDVTRPRPGH